MTCDLPSREPRKRRRCCQELPRRDLSPMVLPHTSQPPCQPLAVSCNQARSPCRLPRPQETRDAALVVQLQTAIRSLYERALKSNAFELEVSWFSPSQGAVGPTAVPPVRSRKCPSQRALAERLGQADRCAPTGRIRRTRRVDNALRFHGNWSISGNSTLPSRKRTVRFRISLPHKRPSLATDRRKRLSPEARETHCAHRSPRTRWASVSHMGQQTLPQQQMLRIRQSPTQPRAPIP